MTTMIMKAVERIERERERELTLEGYARFLEFGVVDSFWRFGDTNGMLHTCSQSHSNEYSVNCFWLKSFWSHSPKFNMYIQLRRSTSSIICEEKKKIPETPVAGAHIHVIDESQSQNENGILKNKQTNKQSNAHTPN